MFKNLVEKLHQKTPLAIASVTNVRNLALRRCMLEELNQKKYTDESFLAEPFYEAMFPWAPDSQKLANRCPAEVNPIIYDMHYKVISREGQNNLVIDTLYEHQKRSIEEIRKGNSIVVTTGTGSGKTECFMYPIFDYLANQLDQGHEIKGVQALFLYPLNALIQSQGDRFEKFCSKFNEKYPDAVHFANYTGRMKDRYEDAISLLSKENGNKISKDNLRTRYPENGVEYIDRATLRSKVPQLLITNSAMLEYALIRKADENIFKNSDLQFIVLDEAHSYTGSNATELAMRLRRVLLAFGKTPSQVRFIATSATVGDEVQTKNFIASIAGIPKEDVDDRVIVIKGHRVVDQLPAATGRLLNGHGALSELRAASPTEWFNILCRTEKARQLRNRFGEGSGRLSQQQVDNILGLSSPESIEFLDFISSAKNQAGEFFIPLKLHAFQKHFSGVWACCNPLCDGRQPTLSGVNSDWKYGRVYFDLNDVKKYKNENGEDVGLVSCKFCNHNVFQVVSCSFCGDINLAAQGEWNEGKLILRIPKLVDEIIVDDDSDEENATKASSKKTSANSNVFPALIHCCDANSEDYRHEWFEYIRENDEKVHLCQNAEKISGLGVVLGLDCELKDGCRCANCRMPFHIGDSMNGNGGFPVGKNTRLSNFGVSSKVLYSTLVKDVLLEDVQSSPDLPMGGRKLLGFTDSRQGTAYYAGRQGIVAEMSATRTWLLNYLLKGGAYNRDRLIGLIEKRIKKIGLNKFHFPMDMEKNEKSFAKLFLWREMTFRSRRKRSLETLGLMQVNYDGLEDVHKPNNALGQFFPSDWDYQNLIKIVLDYGFRAEGALELDGWDEPFLIQKVYAGNPIFIEPFDLSYFNPDKKDNRSNNVAKLIHYYVKDDIEEDGSISDADWINICGIVKQIVTDLTTDDVEILKTVEIKTKKSENGLEDDSEEPPSELYTISWDRISLSLPQSLWVCPSTKTLLDSVIVSQNGSKYSPYMISQSERGRRLPVSAQPEINLATIWAAADKKQCFIDNFQGCDWWTDLHQDVLTSVDEDAFVVTQENTAQISSIQREHDQESFKKGEINILNSSTTMEMGVDIGDVSLVAMTNVPPHEYNYVQRAGRAGRASQGQSFIWTLSSFGGHERKATKNPLQWVEKNTLKQNLNLENDRIVQRHVNAYLLASWIRCQQEFTIDFERKIYKFFLDDGLCAEDAHWSTFLTLVCERSGKFILYTQQDFEDALEIAMSTSPLKHFITQIPTIPIDSSLMEKTQRSVAFARESAINEWNRVYNEWKKIVCDYYSVFIEDLEGTVEFDNLSKKKKSLLYHLRKLLAEYGLGYLIKAGVLPSNGMPIDVVELETPGRYDYDDSECPSRERKIAIREFAPGYSLILNGTRMASRGISFNPISRGHAEHMLIRSYYTCQNCGTPHISGVDSETPQVKCSVCDREIKGTPRRIVEPAGFRALDVDRSIESVLKPPFEQPHVKLIEPETKVFADGMTASFGSALVVYLNGNSKAANCNRAEGRAVGGLKKKNQEVSRNSEDDGYCLCLNCGYVSDSLDSMESNIHEKFAIAYGCSRKKNGKNQREKECKPEQYRMVSLGAMEHTDAFILHIDQLNDIVAANTWALALRNALTDFLALNENEIGWTCQLGRDGVYDIVLFDNAAGGANLSTRCKDNLLILFENARQLLDCGSGCDSICLDCLLTRETQVVAHLLNRNVAMKILDDKFFAKLDLPEEKKYWGDATRFYPDFFAKTSELLSTGQNEYGLNFYLPNEVSLWNLDGWSMKSLVRQNEGRIRFVVSESIWNAAKQDLFLKTELWQLMRIGKLGVIESLPVVGESQTPVVLEQVYGTESILYTAEVLDGSDVDSWNDLFWNAPQKLSCFYGNSDPIDLKEAEIGPTALFECGFNAVDKTFEKETEFGVDVLATNLFSEFATKGILLNQRVKEFVFSDRYLFTPSAIRYVCEMLKFFNPQKVVVYSNRNKSVKTNHIPSGMVSNTWVHDYTFKHLDILKSSLVRVLPECEVKVDSQGASHDRCAWITYEDDTKRLIRFTGSPTIWCVIDSAVKANTMHASINEINVDHEVDVILSVDNINMRLAEDTSIIISK